MDMTVKFNNFHILCRLVESLNCVTKKPFCLGKIVGLIHEAWTIYFFSAYQIIYKVERGEATSIDLIDIENKPDFQ